MQGYCVKCRTKREIKNAKSITMKNGKPATQGTCPKCGTVVDNPTNPPKCPKCTPENPAKSNQGGFAVSGRNNA